MTMNAWTRALVLGAVVAVGAAGCASWRGDTDRSTKTTATEHRSAGTTVSDAAITAKVKTAFAADTLVKAHKINVDTMRGVVTLNGTVKTEAERAQAIKLARECNGVIDVKDNLTVTG